MKTALIILTAFFLIGCKADPPQSPASTQPPVVPPAIVADPTTDTPTPPTTPPPDEPPTTTPPPTTTQPPVVTPPPPPPPTTPTPTQNTTAAYTFYAPGKFFDGSNWTLTTYEKRAASHTYMVGSEIRTLDDFGAILSTVYAPEQGDIVRKTASGFVLCDIMPPAESFALGALSATYSQVHVYNGTTWTEPAHWSTQKWQCDKIIESASGEVFVVDNLGGIHTLGASSGIQTVNDGGLLITNLDLVNKRANFITASGSTLNSWGTNFLLAAKDWQEIGGTFYSANGYKYDSINGLQESVTAMTAFQAAPYPVVLPNGEAPTLLPIGVDAASGVIYWLEANSGYMVEYRIATNQAVITRRLYIGNGLHATGQALKPTLGLLLNGGYVYFTYGNVVNRLELVSGGIVAVLADNVKLEVF